MQRQAVERGEGSDRGRSRERHSDRSQGGGMDPCRSQGRASSVNSKKTCLRRAFWSWILPFVFGGMLSLSSSSYAEGEALAR
eukprot:1193778-Pyramimonas_sp.AAC.1